MLFRCPFHFNRWCVHCRPRLETKTHKIRVQMICDITINTVQFTTRSSILTTISAANKFIAAIFGNLYTSWSRPLISSLYYLETGCKWEMCFRNLKRSESRAKMQPHHCSDFIRGAGLKLFYDTSKKQEFTAPRC